MSTFHGLEMAKQALFAQQSALYTTGHNISNANTDGYSRQRVNFQTMPAHPVPGMNRSGVPGQMGTGVEVGSIQRIRDQFLDLQYRAENSRSGYWSAMSEALSRMEGLLNEPSESGLSETMDQFWQSLQDLAVNPENSGARSVVAQRGLAVAETFNYLSNTLHSIQDDLKSQIEDGDIKTANSLLHQIHNINEQIRKIEPHGMLANDLYDDRDRLIDELSKIMSIKVTRDNSSDSAPANAGGVLTIELVDNQGSSLDPEVILIDGHGNYDDDYFEDLIEITYQNGDDGPVQAIDIKNGDKDAGSGETFSLNPDELFQTSGSLIGLIKAYGYREDNQTKGEYPTMIEQLDKMAFQFATQFNSQHQNGYGLDGNDQRDFFDIANQTGAAAAITVRDEILENPNLIGASEDPPNSEGQPIKGNGAIALELANLFNDSNKANIDGKSINGFYESLIGDLGVKAQEANRMTSNTEILLSQVDHQRMSISSVSLDEEMSNMIKFQHAYNAAARNMTAVDEMIDRIINGMGLVGR